MEQLLSAYTFIFMLFRLEGMVKNENILKIGQYLHIDFLTFPKGDVLSEMVVEGGVLKNHK